MDHNTPTTQLQDVLDSCACFTARQASRLLTRIYDRALAPSGLKTTQFTILAALGVHGALPITVLATNLNLEHTTLTRNIALLKKRGLVRMQSAQDGRIRLARLSEDGHVAVAQALPLWQEVQHKIEDRLDLRAFSEQLRKLLTDQTF